MRAITLLAAALAAIAPAFAARMLSDEAVAAVLGERHVLGIEARQAGDSSGSGIPTTNGTTMDMAAWDREVSEICAAHLSGLEAATNPSGTAICYNVPMLNNRTGRFLADLRLYKISDPTGPFLGVLLQNVQIGLEYNGATVSRVNNTTESVAARSLYSRSVLDELDLGVGLVRRDSNPQLLQTYLFVGQIDQAKLTADMKEPDLEALIIPSLTLTAVNTAGQTASTLVSSNEAAFLLGAFSDLTIQSAVSKASDCVKAMQQQMAAGQVAFVLPGVRILIFPIGLIITSVWLAIGVAAYGFGTYQRFLYAHSFRARKVAIGKQGGKIF